jgi:tRNA pseudouridine55 synthase
MNSEDFKNGQVLLIDKPVHWTSFQVVNKVRGAILKKFNLKKIKVGHAGTLDPLATGLLILCTGKFTKQIEQYQAQTKEYTGTFTIGATTPSFDLETAIDERYSIEHVTDIQIKNTASSFIGDIYQRPPIYSALKKDGKRLYNIARSGKTVEIEPRKVTIESLKISKISLPIVEFKVNCSKGTYIRSLANDFGKALNSGAHLSNLRRTRIGNFKVNDAQTIEAFLKTLTDA